MGESQIIIELAKSKIVEGIGPMQAIKSSIIDFELAKNEALNYKFKGFCSKSRKYIKEESRRRFVEENIGIVYDLAHRRYYWLRDKEYFDDIVNEGVIGLMKGFDNYDSSKGCKLSTYATQWAWGKMQRFVDRFVNEMKHHTNFKKVEKCGFDKIGLENGDTVSLADYLHDDVDHFEKIEDKQIIENFLKFCDERQMLEVARLRLSGKAYTEIEDETDISKRKIKYRYDKAVIDYVSRYKELEGRCGWLIKV